MGSSPTDDFITIAGALKLGVVVEGELEEGASVSSSPLSLSGAQFGPVNGWVVSVVAVGASTEPPCPAVDARQSAHGLGMASVSMADTSEKLLLTMAEGKPDADAVFGVPVLDDAIGSLAEDLGGGIINADGGLVIEDVVVTPAANAALRPQPTDGLPEPPLSPVEPAVVERSGPGVLTDVGQPGCLVATPGVCSFATAVNPDRRADVELSFDPPTDGKQ
ncbi:hypothetical protein Dimus_037458 [Dionaea muscipula]